MNDERFEDLLQEIRDEDVPLEEVRAARERVWQTLQVNEPVACDELRPELRAYHQGTIAPARRLLINDHLSRCVECRRAFADIKRAGKVAPMPARPQRGSSWKRWAAAAAIVVALMYGARGAIDSMLAPAGPAGTVVAVSGSLYRPNGALLPVGTEILEGQSVRTAAGSRAVLRLRDGSEVEMNQRTELAVQSARSGDTIRLSWGDVIVEAADQAAARNLRVVTRDSIASVKGTVFAVSSGTVGSLVSVVEGAVEVSQASGANLLHAGQQAASSPAIGEVSVFQAISWSEEATDYHALLAEFAEIEEQLALSGPSMRRDAELLAYLPADPSAYFAIPNLDGTIAEAISLMDSRVSQSTALMKWWTSADGQEMRRMLQDLEGIASLLGDELVLVFSGGTEPIPLFLAEVRANTAEQVLQAIRNIDTDDSPPVDVIDGILIASDSDANLALLSAQLGLGTDSPFAAEIEDHYDRGVGWLGAINVAAYHDTYTSEYGTMETELGRVLGVSSMTSLFFEQRSSATGDESEATLSFRGEREGMPSWLAAPGAIGSAEYVSSGALFATASSTQDPVEAFDQLVALAGRDGEIMDELRQMETEAGIDIRDDVAASLGTDFVLSIEGLSLTSPQWMAAFEVMNPGALDDAMRRLVESVNAELDGGEQVNLTEETVNGRTWKRLEVVDPSEVGPTPDFTWTHDRGYVVVSTDRATAERAISVRDTGSSLVRSSAFQQQYPGGGGVHSSGFLWLDMSRFGEALEMLGQQSGALARNADPILVVVTGEDDRIRWASRSRLTSLIFDFLLMEPR